MNLKEIKTEELITLRYRISKELKERTEKVEDFINYVCLHTGICVLDKTRRKRHVILRHLMMDYIYNGYGLSTTDVGTMLGGLDHATVVHGKRSIKTRLYLQEKEVMEVNDIFQSVILQYNNIHSNVNN